MQTGDRAGFLEDIDIKLRVINKGRSLGKAQGKKNK